MRDAQQQSGWLEEVSKMGKARKRRRRLTLRILSVVANSTLAAPLADTDGAALDSACEPAQKVDEVGRQQLRGGHQRDRRVRVKRIGALAAAAVIVLSAAACDSGTQEARNATASSDEAEPRDPVGEPHVAEAKVEVLRDRKIRDVRPDVAAPKVPYVIDLTTRAMTPLPQAITQSLALGYKRFAVSQDGSSLAFVGEGGDGSPQIFIAGIDGTGVRQVTHDPRQAISPAWSPDGTEIAYEGSGSGGELNVFVHDLATAESRQLTDTGCTSCTLEPQFTPDGSSIIYTGGSGQVPVTRIVPVGGGRSTLLIGLGGGLVHTGNASMSPDGSLVTFMGGGIPNSDKVDHCGPCRFLANANGTGQRIIEGWIATPAGTWSPDGTRIVLADDTDGQPPAIRVIDVVTGEASTVADGIAAIWIDDHTLLVDV
jgi:Tol biopolymer transport system component